MRPAISTTSLADSIRPWLPGTTGIPFWAMVSRALALSPMRAMLEVDGPMNLIPASSQASAKWAFSERKPNPGWIASESVISAALRMLGMFR